MHEVGRRVLFHLPPVLGIDLSITNEVLLLWAAAAVTFAVLFAAAPRGGGAVPRGAFRNMVEGLIEYLDREVVKSGLGHEAAGWAWFVMTLFFFILFGNLLGMLPAPSVIKSATASISVTSALAFLVLSATVCVSVGRHGPGGFFMKFIPAGLPKWVAALATPIEVLSWLARPLSLAIRLFANMAAGHALILVFVLLASQARWFESAFPLSSAVLMSGFELFVCFIQAFIFALLAGIYIREAAEARG
ncbi:MAG: F0F1 ATP synthase subunit A [Lentisphaerae bacterium]|nr:F0F1 ATP synthase subunit A [Lentisphaerota bacterium]